MRRLALCGLTCLPILTMAGATSTLTTPNYVVRLQEHCEEGVVGCDKVTYHGVHRKTGQAIELKGKTNMVLCADKKTPCHIRNYAFKNGKVVYTVTPEGTLTVTQGNRTLLSESGQWSY